MSDRSLKVTVIGGGSSYTPELIDGLIRYHKELPVTDLYLVDIQEGWHKLEIVGGLAQRMIDHANLPIRVHLTLDRREAIRGASFVLTQIRVGMLDARALDERIPLRYNCIGQETTGAGGMAKALRTIPVILSICRDIEELAPDAWLINFTNPAGIITEAVLKHSRVRTIGLCNLPIHTRMQIAQMMEVEPDDVDIEMVGINHLNWTQRVLIRGMDRTQDVLKAFGSGAEMKVKNIPDHAWGEGFLQSLGSLPCSYLRYYYLKERMLEDQLKQLKQGETRADVIKKLEKELFEIYQNPALYEKPKQLDQRGGAYYSEAAVQLIASIHNNKKDIQIVNTRNNGIIPFLPDDAAIEVPCVISSSGASPLSLSKPLQPAVRGLLQVVKAYEELTIEAAVHGDYHSAFHALTIHPLVGTSALAKAILDDLITAHRKYLPQFA